METGTQNAHRLPDMMWIAAVVALLFLLVAEWLPSFSALAGILGFIALYVVIRQATASDKVAMAVFVLGVVAFIVLPLLWGKYKATQNAVGRARIITDILTAQKIETPGTIGITAYYEYCRTIDDMAGWEVSNQLLRSSTALANYLKDHPEADPATIIKKLQEEQKNTDKLLPLISKIQEVREQCRDTIFALTGKNMTATLNGTRYFVFNTIPSWWLIGFPVLVIGIALYRTKGYPATFSTASVVGGLMIVGFLTIVGYVLLSSIDWSTVGSGVAGVGKSAGLATLTGIVVTALLASMASTKTWIVIVVLLFIASLFLFAVPKDKSKRSFVHGLAGLVMFLSIVIAVLLIATHLSTSAEIPRIGLPSPKKIPMTNRWHMCTNSNCAETVQVHWFTETFLHYEGINSGLVQEYRWKKNGAPLKDNYWYSRSGAQEITERDKGGHEIWKVDVTNKCAIGETTGKEDQRGLVQVLKIWYGDANNCPLFQS